MVAQQRVDAATGPASGLDDAIARDAAGARRARADPRRASPPAPLPTDGDDRGARGRRGAARRRRPRARRRCTPRATCRSGRRASRPSGRRITARCCRSWPGSTPRSTPSPTPSPPRACTSSCRATRRRAGASLDAVVKRTVAPPELEFARTPRTGTAITHRVLALAPGTAVAWPTDARQVRATVEPALDRWAGALLGDPRQIRCDVRYVDGAGELLLVRDLRMASAGVGCARRAGAGRRCRRRPAGAARPPRRPRPGDPTRRGPCRRAGRARARSRRRLARQPPQLRRGLRGRPGGQRAVGHGATARAARPGARGIGRRRRRRRRPGGPRRRTGATRQRGPRRADRRRQRWGRGSAAVVAGPDALHRGRRERAGGVGRR